MAFQFTVENINKEEAPDKIRKFITDKEGTFDEETSTFSGEGVTGNFTTDGDSVTINITAKPMWMPKNSIIKAISKFITS